MINCKDSLPSYEDGQGGMIDSSAGRLLNAVVKIWMNKGYVRLDQGP